MFTVDVKQQYNNNIVNPHWYTHVHVCEIGELMWGGGRGGRSSGMVDGKGGVK